MKNNVHVRVVDTALRRPAPRAKETIAAPKWRVEAWRRTVLAKAAQREAEIALVAEGRVESIDLGKSPCVQDILICLLDGGHTAKKIAQRTEMPLRVTETYLRVMKGAKLIFNAPRATRNHRYTVWFSVAMMREAARGL